MKIRCDLLINGGHRRLVMVPMSEETFEHLCLRLAAFVLFWDFDPVMDMSLDHPAMTGTEFKPDLAALDVSGRLSLWVECGRPTIHKLNKIPRRHPGARLVAIFSSEAEARRVKAEADKKLDKQTPAEFWAWNKTDFESWSQAVSDNTTIVGESSGRTLNLTINSVPLAVDLVAL